MAERSSSGVLAGVLGGVLAGIAVGWLLGRALDGEDRPGLPETEPALRAAADAGGPSAPRLEGSARAPDALPGAPATPAPPVPRPPSAVEGLAAEEWAALPPTVEEVTAGNEARGWSALLTLYALAGRVDPFLAGVPKALAAGVPPEELLGLVALFPSDHLVEVLDRLRQAHPEPAWPPATLADLYVTGGAPQRAVDVLLTALAAAPDASLAVKLVEVSPGAAATALAGMLGAFDADGLGNIGNAFVAAGQGDAALAFLKAALAANPQNHSVLMSLAQVAPELALSHARGLVASGQGGAEVWTWLAQIELQNGNHAAAFAAYREAAMRQPSTEVLEGLMRADPQRAMDVALEVTAETTDDELLGSLAKIALRNGADPAAFDALLRAHERDPTDHEWLLAMVQMDPVRAAEALRATAARYTGDSRDEVIGALGNALRDLGRGDEAFDEYLAAHQMDPGDWEWQRGLADADPHRAIDVLEARRASGGGDANLYGALADAYAGAGRAHDARTLYEQAYAEGGDLVWLSHLARIDPGEAIRRLETVSRERSGEADVWANLGAAYRHAGRYAEARDAYGRAREISPGSLPYEIAWRRLQE
jgi:tetratricopeptide (TPR) repeat protein